MLFKELESKIIERAKIKKFQKETSTAMKLRDYFHGLVENLRRQLVEIDEDFYKFTTVGSFSDNYSILDTTIILCGYDEVVFEFSSEKSATTKFFTVTFKNNQACLYGRDLTKEDLEQFLFFAFR